MFKITNNQISINRGDIGCIRLVIPLKDGSYYTFENGDVVTFGVYNVQGYQSSPVIYKTVEVDTENNYVDITLSKTDTQIGNIINQPVKYWYEIQLNGEQTVVGYDNNGPKIFMLFPEGMEVEEE